jgi:hypothetical protein
MMTDRPCIFGGQLQTFEKKHSEALSISSIKVNSLDGPPDTRLGQCNAFQQQSDPPIARSRRPPRTRSDYDLRPLWTKLLVVSVNEKSLKSQELLCRPRHMSLLPVLRRDGPCRLGRDGAAGVVVIEPWLVVDVCRGCCGLCVAYVGLVGWLLDAWGNDSGGSMIGDLDRSRAFPLRERLRDRPRILEVRAPKNEASAGDWGPRAKVPVGESVSEPGDMAPEDCEPLVFVRMGGGGWKCECWSEGMLAWWSGVGQQRGALAG